MKKICINNELLLKMQKQERKNKIRWIAGVGLMLVISIYSYDTLSSIGKTLNLEFVVGIVYSWYILAMVYIVNKLIKRLDFNEKFKIISETPVLKEIIDDEIKNGKTEISVDVEVTKNEE